MAQLKNAANPLQHVRIYKYKTYTDIPKRVKVLKS